MIGITRDQLANYETNRSLPSPEVTRRLARIWSLPPEWFWDSMGVEPSPRDSVAFGVPPPGSDPPAGSEILAYAAPGVGRRLFPLVGHAGAAAFGLSSEGVGIAEDWVEFSDDLYRPDRFAVTVKGDSMEPRIRHGTYALIEPDPNPPEGVFVAARSGEHEYVVKTLRVVESRRELHPEKSGYPVLVPGEGWVMIGYVVGLRLEKGKRKYIEEGDNDGIRP